MTVGLYAGRFQPFHKGHLVVVNTALEKCDDVIIVIGSSQISHLPDDPFTAGERYQMIHDAFTKKERENIHIIPVFDINRYGLWFKHVESQVPPFNVVYSNSPFVKQLAVEAGYEVKGSRRIDVPGSLELHYGDIEEYIPNGTRISASLIRQLMLYGVEEYWRYLVPDNVRDFIWHRDLISRLKRISVPDK